MGLRSPTGALGHPPRGIPAGDGSRGRPLARKSQGRRHRGRGLVPTAGTVASGRRYREALRPEVKRYARQVVQNAKALASGLSFGGLRIVAGGTENHMMLVDTRPLGLTGRDAEAALIASGLVVNKNAIPFDPQPPTVTSGIRISTPALTSRDLDVSDMENVAGYILEALHAHSDETKLAKLGAEVAKYASKFPVPGLDS